MHSNETVYLRFSGQNTSLHNGILCAWVNSRQSIRSALPALHVNECDAGGGWDTVVLDGVRLLENLSQACVIDG